MPLCAVTLATLGRKMSLFDFKYFPNPLITGSIEKSDSSYNCSRTFAGYNYTYPLFAEDGSDECNCPLCIANGTVHKNFDVWFTDFDGTGDYRITGTSRHRGNLI